MAATKRDGVLTMSEIGGGIEAKVEEPKYTTLTSPLGQKTKVPEELVEALKASGYK